MKPVDNTETDHKEAFATHIPASLHKKFREISQREGRSMSEILTEQLTNYVKIHGSGNPVYKLENWSDPTFKITPAFFAENKTWMSYIQKCTPTEQREIDEKLFALDKFLKNKMRYGDVNVRTY